MFWWKNWHYSFTNGAMEEGEINASLQAEHDAVDEQCDLLYLSVFDCPLQIPEWLHWEELFYLLVDPCRQCYKTGDKNIKRLEVP